MVRILPIILLAGIAGCSGNSDSNMEGPLVMTADKESIMADGSDMVTFTVMKGNVEISTRADIYMVSKNGNRISEKLDGNAFSSRAEGTYVFEARFTSDTKYISEQITVTVNEYEISEVFFRRMFGMQFTSTGCSSCPSLTASLDNLPEAYAERLVRASFHIDYSSSYTDPMHLPITFSYMVDLLYSTGGLPSFYLDMMPETKVVSEQNLIINQMDRVMRDYPAICGVKTATVYSESENNLKITFTVKSSLTSQFRIAPFIVEDGIVADQTGDRNYVHNTTVRRALSLSLIGDKLGTIKAGEETVMEYNEKLDSGWKLENLRVVVCVLDTVDGSTYRGNNSDQCGIDDSTDYLYNR